GRALAVVGRHQAGELAVSFGVPQRIRITQHHVPPRGVGNVLMPEIPAGSGPRVRAIDDAANDVIVIVRRRGLVSWKESASPVELPATLVLQPDEHKPLLAAHVEPAGPIRSNNLVALRAVRPDTQTA